MLNALEQAAIASLRAGKNATSKIAQLEDHQAWLTFGLQILLESARQVRAMRFAPLTEAVTFKHDGSPSIAQEQDIEAHLRTQLQHFAPTATCVGEESGGTLNTHGFSVAIDPVDGTWALINRSATHATSLAFFKDRQIFLGMVANAANGEIGYALEGQCARLLQLSCFGENDVAAELPLDQAPVKGTLVNLQPARGAEQLSARLHQAWTQRRISMVKAMGGSPAWALLEAAKGSFIYVNRWSERDPEPFDLAGSVFLLRQAGGEAIGLDEQPIDAFSHRGPFVSGINRQAMAEVVDICRQ